MRKLGFSLLIAAGTIAACAVKPVRMAAPAGDDGALYVYLEPWPAEASRFSLHLQELSAVREDGSVVPLPLRLPDLEAATVGRTRLLGWGPLPAGSYAGVAVRVRKASLREEEGPAALRIPEEAALSRFRFVVTAERAVVLELGLRYRDSIIEGYRLEPVFAVSAPGKLATGLSALVSCREGGAVAVFDKVSGEVTAVVLTGRGPTGLALDPERRRAYVAVSQEDAIETLDLLDPSILARLRLTAGDEPRDLVLTPDGRTLLTANAGSGTVSVVDAASLFERERIPVGNGPDSILMDRAGRRAYVLNTLSDTVSILDVPSRAVVGTIAVDAEPFRGELNRDGSRLFVIHRVSPYLLVMDVAAQRVEQRVHVGPGASALKVDPVTNRIYVAHSGSDSLDVFDPFSLLPLDSIPVGEDVGFLAIDGEGNNLCMTLPQVDEVGVVRLVGKQEVARIDVGEDPYELALLGER